MLHALRFKTEQEKNIPGMNVTVDTTERTVTFEGKGSEITKAASAVRGLVDTFRSSTLEMSEELIKLMRGIKVITHMVGVFRKNRIVAVYAHEGEKTLGVYARDGGHLDKAIKLIKTETCEETCVDSPEAFSMQDWVTLKKQLQSKYVGLLTITESGSCVILSGVVDAVADAKGQIHLQAAARDVTHDILESVQRGGCTVQVVRGDLTAFHAEATVNAANESLLFAGGLGKAIVDAGTTDIIIIHIYP